MGLSDRLVRTITRRNRTVIAALLVLSLVVGSGVTAVEQSSSFDLFETVVESLVVTLVVVFAFLMAVYRRLYGSALLGAVTLFPS